ncbi:MAG: CcdB family protein [Thauera sp.]|nr:CcdB family protein [Thauera sp.]
MARFDVYRHAGPGSADTPYLMDVQADLLDGLDTRVVVPLRRRDRLAAASVPPDLMPTFDIEGVACVLETPKLAAVPLRLLKTRVCSLVEHRAQVTGALDFLFQGY